MDRISLLPDQVLGYILSFLPTKTVPSTSLLSKRWRNVFPLVSHLDFDSTDFPNPSKFNVFVTNFLQMHAQGHAPIKKFTLKKKRYVQSHVQIWISSMLERGVVDLDLTIFVNPKEEQPVPSLLFKSKRLVKLRLGREYEVKLPKNAYLPMLKILHLHSITLNGEDDVLGNFLSCCPVLEELVVKETGEETQKKKEAREKPRKVDGLTLSVSSPSLKKLWIQFELSVIVSLDVPNLVYFDLMCAFGSKYQISNVDSLVEARLNLRVDKKLIERVKNGNAGLDLTDMVNLINAIKSVKVLQFSNNDVLELLYFSSQELPAFDNLVRLSIKNNEEKQGWQNLPRMLKNSPNLNTLIFKGLNRYRTKKCGGDCVCCDSKKKISSCLSSSKVKVLEILFYKGTKIELKQVKYFLKKLPCLELVKIRATRNVLVTIDMQRDLLALPRASSNCKIQVLS